MHSAQTWWVSTEYSSTPRALKSSRRPCLDSQWPSGEKPCRAVTCMCPSMSLQVRTFCIYFVAALEIASVDTPFSRVWGFRPSLASCALNTKWWDWTGKRKRRLKRWANTALCLVPVPWDLRLTVCSFIQTQGPMSTLLMSLSGTHFIASSRRRVAWPIFDETLLGRGRHA